jgi:TRAP-type C4-dicarboxylate transport system permease small subunit
MKVLRWLNEHFEEVLSSVFLVVMTVLVAIQIAFRTMGVPLSWTEELARYCFVWLIYISCSYAIKTRSHIKVDLLNIMVKEKGKFILGVFSNSCFLVFAAVIAYFSYGSVYRLKEVNPQVSPAVGFPLWVAYLAISVGFTLMVYRIIADTLLAAKEYKELKAEVKGGALA